MLAKKFALGFGIAILLPMVVHYGVSTFNPRPNWRDYNENYDYQRYQNATPEGKAKLDQERKERAEERRRHEKRFTRHLFFVATPVGIGSIIIGSLVPVQAIGSGL